MSKLSLPISQYVGLRYVGFKSLIAYKYTCVHTVVAPERLREMNAKREVHGCYSVSAMIHCLLGARLALPLEERSLQPVSKRRLLLAEDVDGEHPGGCLQQPGLRTGGLGAALGFEVGRQCVPPRRAQGLGVGTLLFQITYLTSKVV